jgi:NhaP-type Na+/H+ or K+/H+ antiporter
MQTNSPPTLFKQIKVIFAPLFVGALIGVLMGCVSVLLLKVLPSNYTQKQEELAFILFVLFGAFMGLVDTVRRYLAWLRFRKSQ